MTTVQNTHKQQNTSLKYNIKDGQQWSMLPQQFQHHIKIKHSDIMTLYITFMLKGPYTLPVLATVYG